MDFHTLSRRDLQTLCKKNHIPANTTNVAMADALQALQSVEGLTAIQESMMLQSLKTNQKSTVRKSKKEDQASPLPRSRRVSAKPPVLDDDENKEQASETQSLVNTMRRVSKKEESKGILGTTVARRTRQTAKKEVGSEMVSTEVRRSTRVRGIKMSPLAKEVDEEKDVDSKKLKVEAEEKSDVKVDEEGKVVEAEIVKLQFKEDGNVDEKELEEKKVVDQEEQNEEKVISKGIDPVEEMTVENKEEDEAIAEEKQATAMENFVFHVEETLVENKDEDEDIGEKPKQEETIDFKTENECVKLVIEEMNILVDTKHNDKEDHVEDNVASVTVKVEEYHVVSKQVEVEEQILVDEDSPIKGLITSNSKIMNQELNIEITEEVKNVQMASEEFNEVVVDNGEFSIQEFSEKTETNVSKSEIVELAENDLNFKLSTESNNNKGNSNLVSVEVKAKSNEVNYEKLSLRRLKSAYKEMVAMKSKGEEKRTALKAVNENCI